MAYKRKTKDVVTIQRFSKCWGWEDVNSYSQPDYERPREAALADINQYRLSEPEACYRLSNHRERIEKVEVPAWEENRPDYFGRIRVARGEDVT